MTRLFKKLCAKEVGRDFVLGDIHGAYDLVIQGICASSQSMEPFALDDSHALLFELGVGSGASRKREAQR